MHVVIEALSNYIREKLLDGKGVTVKGLGAFSFEVISDTIKPAQYYTFDTRRNLDHHREERKHVHKIRPCFIVDSSFKYSLANFSEKEEISAPKSQSSLYQKGFGMIYCNPVPIAAACYLTKDVVSDSIAAFVKAINDLTTLGHSLRVNLDFVTITVRNKSLSHSFTPSFESQLNASDFEHRVRLIPLGIQP